MTVLTVLTVLTIHNIVTILTFVTIATVLTLVALVICLAVFIPKQSLFHHGEVPSMGLCQIQNIHADYDHLEIPQPIYRVWVGSEGRNHERYIVLLGCSYYFSNGGVEHWIFALPGTIPERKAKRGTEVPRPKHEAVDTRCRCNGVDILDSKLFGLISTLFLVVQFVDYIGLKWL